MGTIYYGGSATPIHIEDRALAHLKVVIATKLRRSESFTVSWQHPEGEPRGRSTIWLHPSIPIRFVFDDPEPAELNREWIEELRAVGELLGRDLAGRGAHRAGARRRCRRRATDRDGQLSAGVASAPPSFADKPLFALRAGP